MTNKGLSVSVPPNHIAAITSLAPLAKGFKEVNHIRKKEKICHDNLKFHKVINKKKQLLTLQNRTVACSFQVLKKKQSWA